MALEFTLVDSWDDGRRVHVTGTVAASGNYAAGGDTLDLSGIDLSASLDGTPEVDANAAAHPLMMGTAWMDGVAGYDFAFDPGAALNRSLNRTMNRALDRSMGRSMNSGRVKIFQDGSSGPFSKMVSELASGAYPEAIAAHPLTFYGIFKKMQ